MICCDVNNQVVMLSVSGEIFSRVIYHVVRADWAGLVEIACAANAYYFRAEYLGKLHRKRTHTTGCAVDQNLLTSLNLPVVAKGLQCGHRRYWDGCCLLEGDVSRLQQQCLFASA